MMKSGFTTGSAATAASKAALIMLITKEKVNTTSITVPSLVEYCPVIYGQEININTLDNLNEDNYAKCYVVKESGDDPDITSGLKIYSKVSFSKNKGIHISGGEGIGVITRPGLDQPVGEYAINSTPRKMIEAALLNVLDDYDVELGVDVEISVPGGEEIAKKTFNPHMGIEGGISIIGTSGIVKPMSTDALIDTIKLDIKMQRMEGRNICVIVPGNYGVTFLENNYGISEKNIVMCSNFAGDSIRFAADAGFKKILFCAHIGKMIKISGGVMNTHSKYGDRRMEFMCDAYKEVCKEKADIDVINKIMECVSTTAALDVLDSIDIHINDKKIIEMVSDRIVNKTKSYLEKECDNRAEVNCILYENKYGELAKTDYSMAWN